MLKDVKVMRTVPFNFVQICEEEGKVSQCGTATRKRFFLSIYLCSYILVTPSALASNYLQTRKRKETKQERQRKRAYGIN
jgi:hypothetical protein